MGAEGPKYAGRRKRDDSFWDMVNPEVFKKLDGVAPFIADPPPMKLHQ